MSKSVRHKKVLSSEAEKSAKALSMNNSSSKKSRRQKSKQRLNVSCNDYTEECILETDPTNTSAKYRFVRLPGNGTQGKYTASLITPSDISDKYRFVRLLGKGTQGKVYQARRVSDGNSVAIKVLNIHSIQNWKEYDLFWREAKTLQSLKIDGVAQFYEAKECLESDEPHAYLVQQYIQGQTLADMIKSGARFSIQDIFSFAEQLIKILKQLHHHDPPIIHRDIKPSNIMLEPDGNHYRVYLTDFGAVCNPQIQRGGSTVAGTFGYMPSEQLMGHVTPASDIYALGVTLVELLSGVSPADMEVVDLRLAIEKPLENLPYPVVSLLRRMTMPNIEDRLCDYDAISKSFHDFSLGDFSQSESLPALRSEKDTNRALNKVNRLGQKGNLDLWLALPEQTPREIPKCYQNLKSYPQSFSSKLLSWVTLRDFKKNPVDNGYFLTMFIILSLLFFSPSQYQSAHWYIYLTMFVIFTLPWFLAKLSMKAVEVKNRIKKSIEKRRMEKAESKPIHNILRKGRKALATVVSVKYAGLQNGLPIFTIRYSFNPPDDSMSTDLIHEISVTNDPELSPGDPLPILYEISPDTNNRVVKSLPFPLPVERLSLLESCYCTTINGLITNEEAVTHQ